MNPLILPSSEHLAHTTKISATGESVILEREKRMDSLLGKPVTFPFTGGMIVGRGRWEENGVGGEGRGGKIE